MSKVRINDLARELEVKSKPILDALIAVGVTEPKTHSSSIEADEAEKVRNYFKNQRRGGAAAKPAAEARPAFDLSHISKPGDAMKAILARKQAEEDARRYPQRAMAVAPPAAVAASAAAPVVAKVAAAPVAAAVVAPAPRRIVPQPRQAPMVTMAPTPAIASKPPLGTVIVRPPVVVAAPPVTHAAPVAQTPVTAHAHAAPVVVAPPVVAKAPVAAPVVAPAPPVAAAAPVAAPVVPVVETPVVAPVVEEKAPETVAAAAAPVVPAVPVRVRGRFIRLLREACLAESSVAGRSSSVRGRRPREHRDLVLRRRWHRAHGGRCIRRGLIRRVRRAGRAGHRVLGLRRERGREWARVREGWELRLDRASRRLECVRRQGRDSGAAGSATRR